MGFIFDATNVEFVGGVVAQLPQIKAILAANYNSGFDANWKVTPANITATLNGNPTRMNGKVVCTGIQGLYYDIASNTIESHKFKYTPNYNISPLSNVNLLTIYNGTNNNDRFLLTHSPSGNTLRFTLENSIGGSVINVDTAVGAAFTPTAGQEYEFEVVINSIAGTVRLFVDGNLHGTNTPGVWTRGTSLTRFYLGASPAIYNVAQASFDDYYAFYDAQHTESYVPGYTVSDFKCLASNVDMPAFVHTGLGSVLSLMSITTIQKEFPQYSIKLNAGNYQYWNGTDWVDSDATYAQSNDAATINTNISSLVATGITFVFIRIHFTNTTTSNNVDNLIVNYNGNTLYPITDPIITPVTSISQDALNSFITVLTSTGLDSIQFVLKLDNINKYWNGTVWIDSDGTLAQTNDITTIQTNLSSFTTRGSLVPVIYLHSDNGLTTPNIDDIVITYDFFGGVTTPENVCLVWGYLYDEINIPVGNANIIVIPNQYGTINDKTIDTNPTTVVTDNTGYWEIPLIETQTALDTWAYEFNINGFKSRKFIPNTISARFNDLIDSQT